MGTLVPAKTSPLAKAIRTLEGWLLAAATVTPWVVGLIDPHTLPPNIAIKWAAASAIALAVSRTILKVAAIAKGETAVPPPQPPVA